MPATSDWSNLEIRNCIVRTWAKARRDCQLKIYCFAVGGIVKKAEIILVIAHSALGLDIYTARIVDLCFPLLQYKGVAIS